MAVWHLGEGRLQKLGAVAFPKESTVLDSPFPCSHSPPPEGYKRNRCRARPSLRLKGRLYPSGNGEQRWEVSTPPSRRPECNRQHKDGAEERAENGESQVKRPRGPPDPVGREQPPMGRGRESPSSAPLRSRDTGWRLESLAVWSAGPCVHPPPRPALGFSWPLRLSPTGRGGRSSGQHGLPWPPERGL